MKENEVYSDGFETMKNMDITPTRLTGVSIFKKYYRLDIGG